MAVVARQIPWKRFTTKKVVEFLGGTFGRGEIARHRRYVARHMTLTGRGDLRTFSKIVDNSDRWTLYVYRLDLLVKILSFIDQHHYL